MGETTRVDGAVGRFLCAIREAQDPMVRELRSMQAENERLRAALSEIADNHPEGAPELARRALQQTPECPYYPGCTPDACTKCWEHDRRETIKDMVAESQKLKLP